MATTTAQSIIDKAATALLDIAGTRWPATELLSYLNDGQREAAKLRPELTSTMVDVALIAGVEQSIPADGHALLDVVRNTGIGGGVPGTAITKADEVTLSQFNPGWVLDVASAVVKHFMPDARTPRKFRVYPAQPVAPGNVEMLYSKTPIDIAANAVITLDDAYENALRDYVVYRAMAKEAETQNEAKAGAYYKLFLSGIGVA